jgi:hypothetical protein
MTLCPDRFHIGVGVDASTRRMFNLSLTPADLVNPEPTGTYHYSSSTPLLATVCYVPSLPLVHYVESLARAPRQCFTSRVAHF